MEGAGRFATLVRLVGGVCGVVCVACGVCGVCGMLINSSFISWKVRSMRSYANLVKFDSSQARRRWATGRHSKCSGAVVGRELVSDTSGTGAVLSGPQDRGGSIEPEAEPVPHTPPGVSPGSTGGALQHRPDRFAKNSCPMHDSTGRPEPAHRPNQKTEGSEMAQE